MPPSYDQSQFYEFCSIPTRVVHAHPVQLLTRDLSSNSRSDNERVRAETDVNESEDIVSLQAVFDKWWATFGGGEAARTKDAIRKALGTLRRCRRAATEEEGFEIYMAYHKEVLSVARSRRGMAQSPYREQGLLSMYDAEELGVPWDTGRLPVPRRKTVGL